MYVKFENVDNNFTTSYFAINYIDTKCDLHIHEHTQSNKIIYSSI